MSGNRAGAERAGSHRASRSDTVSPWVLGLIAVGAAASATAAVAAFVTAKFSRSVVIPTDSSDESLRIHSVDEGDGTITLGVSADSLVAGRYSLWFAGGTGHARVGDIVSVTAGRVTRRLERVDYGDLADARWCRLGSWYYLDPRETGLDVVDVEVETELGLAPAWFVPATDDQGHPSDRWVIQVHGRGVRRAETIRALPLFHELGYSTLQISYRNDGEAPRSPDGRYALGDTEWHDVDAAMKYAIDNGAKQLILMGWSMGGATVLQAATRSVRASYLRAVVLDSPVVAWSDTIVFQGHLNHLPEPISKGVMATIGSGVGKFVAGQAQPINFKRLDFVARAAEITFPILILHSDDDGFVPSTASRRLAEARPDVVTLVPFSIAKHVRLWNYDPVRWTNSIRDWLTSRGLAASD
ncbi:alpha/beta hydrolase family protein [Subtercola frigoramans]|uniref:Alpha-beta hydrolase superfamily lysophospholipase n=1 Tax=Subtercola frigoramans TaxID=120298 RepID=A0ABS2L4W2_9MICO|nr:alpha/beta fold hydrolase [Subtercola frigoramans]MBM7472112.1 alpha-beta hydrolase superfamily lysophospholipase [Subtercola frigoramans]